MSVRTLLVFLSLCLLGLSRFLPYQHNFGHSLVDRCQFRLGNRVFNLCPIIHNNGRIAQVERLSPVSSIRVVYSFGLAELSPEVSQVGLDQ